MNSLTLTGIEPLSRIYKLNVTTSEVLANELVQGTTFQLSDDRLKEGDELLIRIRKIDSIPYELAITYERDMEIAVNSRKENYEPKQSSLSFWQFLSDIWNDKGELNND